MFFRRPLSRHNSLLTGKITGNFADSDTSPRFWRPGRPVNSMASKRIPYATEQGIFFTEQGIFAKEQGS
jgi:hypothetical protein